MNDYYKKMGWSKKEIKQHVSMMSSIHSHQLVSVVPQEEKEMNEMESQLNGDIDSVKERFAGEGEDPAYDFESFARAIWHYEELIEATNDPEKIKEYQEEINKIKEEEQAHMKGLGLI